MDAFVGRLLQSESINVRAGILNVRAFGGFESVSGHEFNSDLNASNAPNADLSQHCHTSAFNLGRMRFQKERMRALSERLRSMFGRMRDLFLRCVPDSLKIENSITFPDHSTSLLSHNKSWRYLQEIGTRHKRTQVELTQTQTNAVERTHAGVERRILLAPFRVGGYSESSHIDPVQPTHILLRTRLSDPIVAQIAECSRVSLGPRCMRVIPFLTGCRENIFAGAFEYRISPDLGMLLQSNSTWARNPVADPSHLVSGG
ncbi:hypothetical protein EDD85DRAFT_795967 [Armillaria nabsnona]|nr:hypothetical protein EDD85DRAFT_795967 [Armillaria nabsnona]